MKAKLVNITTDYGQERYQVRSLLVLGESYEVDKIETSRSYTDIYLVGFKYPFNSVFFEFDDEEEYDKLSKESFDKNYGKTAGDK